MPVDETKTLNVTCDNPNCPGNDLDPSDRLGWLFMSSEVYGEPTTTHVFCCTDCVGNTALAHGEIFTSPPPAEAAPPTPVEAAPPPPEGTP